MAQKMNNPGVLVDEHNLDLSEFSEACAVEQGWVVERVSAGALRHRASEPGEWRFDSADLVRARRLSWAELVFDANEDAAALIADLIEEIHRLRECIAQAHLHPPR